MINREFLMPFCAALIFAVTSCNQTPKQQQEQPVKMVTVTHELGKTDVRLQPKKVLVFDMGTLENQLILLTR